jgi:Nucleoside 2-deoxyribosyltransferase
MRLPDFTGAQIRLLDVIYEGFREAGTWPTTSYVEARLHKEHGLDMDTVLEKMPHDSVVAAAGYTENSKVQPALFALRGVKAAETDLDRFVTLIRFAAEQESQTRPGPLDASRSEITNTQAADIWPDKPSGSDLARVIVLAALEPLHTSMGGPNEDGTWNVSFDRRVRRYHGVRDIDDYLERRPDPPQRTWAAPPPAEPYVFIVMPFETDWSANVKEAIDYACSNAAALLAGLRWQRADDITEPGRITDQIISAIERSDLLIADITGSNPNVLFELGYADALNKPIIVLNQDVAATPFDIKDWRQIIYKPDDLGRLTGLLGDFLAGSLRTAGFLAPG